MSTLTQALRTAQSGLLVNQRVMDTIAQNVANVNTEGYSRKVANLENRAVNGTGAGVQIAEVIRKVDEGLLTTLRRETGELNELTVQENYWARMQDLFGSPESNSSIAHVLEQLTSAVEALVTTPERTLEQTEVVRQAENATLLLQQLTQGIQDLRLQADQEIADVTARINALVTGIDQLNDDIIANGSVSRDTTDLRDQRDVKLTELSGLIDIRYFFRGDGDVVVFTSAGRTLVETVPPDVSHEDAATVSATTTHAGGEFGGIFVGDSSNPANDITDEVRDGKLKGLIDLRDGILPNLQSQLDDLTATLRDTVNQIHNRGVSFPGAQSYAGTRQFIESDTSTIKLDPSGSADDVRIVLFDSSGNQQHQTSLNTIMTGAGYSSRGSGNDWTIDAVAATLQSWLRVKGSSSAAVSVNSSGLLTIDLNNTSLNLAFRDEASSTAGADRADATIAFDSNADGTADETVSGFANFFGLNDLFVDGVTDKIWETDVMVSSFTATAATLTFRDSSGLIDTFAISAGDSLSDIASAINLDAQLSLKVEATVIPDGSGYRLRLAHTDGSSFAITQAAGNTFMTNTGLDVADVGVAGSIAVRSDILTTPALLSRGTPQWDASKGSAGEYFMSIADETVIAELSDTMTHNVSFKQAGGLPNVSYTLAQRAASIVATNASLADDNAQDILSQRALQEALQHRHLSDSAVNIDEELAQLIIFQQAFSASARVMATINTMFDALEDIV